MKKKRVSNFRAMLQLSVLAINDSITCSAVDFHGKHESSYFIGIITNYCYNPMCATILMAKTYYLKMISEDLCWCNGFFLSTSLIVVVVNSA